MDETAKPSLWMVGHLFVRIPRIRSAVPPQKWMKFYTNVLTKLGVGNNLSLNVSVSCKPEGSITRQRIEEIKVALRELGLDDEVSQ